MEAYKADILDMRRRGVSKQDIALALRVQTKRVAAALEKWGDPFPAPANQRLEGLREEILSDKRRGVTREEMARRYGCSIDSIAKKLQEWGEVNQRGSKYDKSAMQRMRDSGMTCREIAVVTGCSEATVHSYTRPALSAQRKRTEEIQIYKPVGKYEPGKRYGDYIFLETVHGATTLHRFRHKCGWSTSFTDIQLREAKVG